MPNRILKESICTSENINALTDAEEVFFYRLLVQADDYGRMDARPQILRSKCYPWRVDTVKESAVKRMLIKLAAVGLLYLYTVGGQAYLQFATWDKHQQVRARRSKFPAPEEHLISRDSMCNQPLSDASTCPRNPIQSESESESNPYSVSDSDVGKGYPPEFSEFWAIYPRRKEKLKAGKAWVARLKEGDDGIAPSLLVLAARNYADECKRKGTAEDYIKLPATFLGPTKPYLDYLQQPIPDKPARSPAQQTEALNLLGGDKR